MRKFIAFTFVLLLIFNCSTNLKLAKVDSYPFEIFFGHTGGFSNINPVIIIKNSGEVLKKDNLSSNPYPLKRLDRNKIDSLYLLIKESNFAYLTIKHISNYTNYIEIKSENLNNKIMWYDDSQIPDEVKKLYSFLMNQIKK